MEAVVIKKLASVLKWAGIILLALAIGFCALLLYLTATEYKPQEREAVAFSSDEQAFSPGGGLTVLSWNIGYSGLGAGEEFVMDGGRISSPSKGDVAAYLAGIKSVLKDEPADVYLLQEVDKDSARSYGTDEREEISAALGLGYAFAMNYSCRFVPIPVPVLGRIESGLATYTGLSVDEAERVQLPIPFSWPSRVANLKRCLLLERIDLEGTESELVLVNLHLEAYDDGAGKLAQTEMLMDILTEEYAKGNYVIAGGDWNQTFPGIDQSVVPVLNESYWAPGTLEESALSEGWHYAADTGAPSCRLLNMPYVDDPEVMQFYIIDGFLLSPNVEAVSVETLDRGFLYSDHQPVKLEAKLK